MNRLSANWFLTRVWPAWVPGVILGAAFLLSVALFFPGELSSDSNVQLGEARSGAISDWHSVALTHIWRLMLSVYDEPGTMLVFQLVPYWAGAALFVLALAKVGRDRQAWGIVGVSMFPHFWFFNHYVLKDTAFYSGMFLASGLMFLAIIARRERTMWWGLICSIAVLFCLLVRVNAAFAIAPLLSGHFLFRLHRLTVGRFMLLTAIVAGISLIVAKEVNIGLLEARDTDASQSLQLFDLVGIHYHSGDPNVWGRYAISNDEADKCYTSYFWDTLGPNGICAFLRLRIGEGANHTFSDTMRSERRKLWLMAIAKHPYAYLQHRLRHFNSSTFFAVPALHGRLNKVIRSGSEGSRRVLTDSDRKFDYVKKSFLVWPATWLAMGLGLLIMLWPHRYRSIDIAFGAILIASGLAYGFAYLLIGVATDVRYYLWTTLAVMLGATVAWEGLRDAWLLNPRRRILALTGIGGVVGIGLLCRWLDVPYI